MGFATFLLLLCSWLGCVASQTQMLEGYLQAVDTGNFLQCRRTGCRFISGAAQATYFKRVVGKNGQYSFKVTKGTGYGSCLVRNKCESFTSHFKFLKHDYARLGSCNDCGAKVIAVPYMSFQELI